MQHHLTPPGTSEWPDSLIELLQRQRRLVEELFALAERQAELIREGSTDPLLQLLARRQHLIDRFHASQAELGRLTGGLQERVAALDEERRGRVQGLLAEIGERLDEVMRRDERDQKALQEARDRARHELASVDASRQARRAYLGPGEVNNRFSDRKV